jgi:TRAP-type C4-dicarboxylate transport system permease small subunit
MSPLRAREARPGPIDRFIDAVAAISRLGGVAAVALLLAAVLVICQLVFMRYVLQA